MVYRETFFVNPPASSSSRCPEGFNPWISDVTEHISPHVTSERQIPDTTLDPRCRSGPSARNSLDPNEGRFSKDYGADQQRLQISDLHFDKSPTPITFACWKGSKKWRWLTQWMISNFRVPSEELMGQTLS